MRSMTVGLVVLVMAGCASAPTETPEPHPACSDPRYTELAEADPDTLTEDELRYLDVMRVQCEPQQESEADKYVRSLPLRLFLAAAVLVSAFAVGR